jgi:hypothetical protein
MVPARVRMMQHAHASARPLHDRSTSIPVSYDLYLQKPADRPYQKAIRDEFSRDWLWNTQPNAHNS